MTKGYCFKCKEEREIENTNKIKMKNGRFRLKGSCTKCSSRMTKFL